MQLLGAATRPLTSRALGQHLLRGVAAELPRPTGDTNRPCSAEHPQLEKLGLGEACDLGFTAKPLTVLNGDAELHCYPPTSGAGLIVSGHACSVGAQTAFAWEARRNGARFIPELK